MLHSLGQEAIWVSTALAILSTFAAALRVVSRRQKRAPLMTDDFLLGFAVILVWGLVVAICIAVSWGLGMEEALAIQKFGGLTNVLVCLFVTEIFYGMSLAVVKISILLMYARIFPTRFFRVGATILGVITVTWWLAIFIVSIWSCSPIAYQWDKMLILKYPDAHCVDGAQFYIGNSVPNIITDVLILALPIREVMRLQVSTSQRVAVGGMFALGGLVVIISIIRLVSLFTLDMTGPNASRSLAIPWLYSVVEPCIGIISACLPTLRPIILLLIPNCFKSAHSQSGLHSRSHDTPLPKPRPSLFDKVKGGEGTRSFERLNEENSTEEVATHTTVIRGKSVTNETVEEYHMQGISVRRDVDWEESRVV